MRTLGAVLVLWLGLAALSQAHADARAAEDRWLQLLHAKHGEVDAEPIVLAKAHGHAVRRGSELILRLTSGKTLAFPDSDDPDRVLNYKLMAYLPARHFFMLWDELYEGGEISLVDDRTGEETVIPWYPVFSPDGTRLLIQNDGEAFVIESENLEIWRRDGGRMVREWSINPGKAETGIDTVFAFRTDVVRWSGNTIILAFAREERHWTGTLTLASDGWRLWAPAPAAP